MVKETKFYGKSVLMIFTPIESIVTAATRVKDFDRRLLSCFRRTLLSFDHPDFRPLTFDRSAAQSSSRMLVLRQTPGWRGNEVVTLSPIQLQ